MLRANRVASTLLRLPSFRAALVLHLLSAIGLSFVPLFDVLGFERAFVSGLLAAPLSAALGIGLQRRAAAGQDPLATFRTAVVGGLALLAPTALAGATVEVVREPCSPGDGLLFLTLTAGTGTAFGAALGIAAAALLRRPPFAGIAVAICLALSFAASIVRLYTDPQIFAFSLPFGYWPGSLYDEDVRITPALWAHRALAVAIALAVVLALRRRAWSLAAAALLAVVAYQIEGRGESLGFDQTRETLTTLLSRHAETGRFALYADPSITPEQLAGLQADLDLRHQQLTRFFGRSPEGRIHVFAYRDVAQKKKLMGASQTQIARPWAREIHIHGYETPHGVLKHELAHVFAGELATGLFKVPAASVVLVNIGLVEGTAVAADWPAQQLTVHGWARAMRALDLAPDPRKTLYPAGFWSISSSRAYTIAGSFIRHLIDRHGIDRFAALYSGNDFRAAYGRTLDELTSEWEQEIDALPLSEADLLVAEHRFKQPGIFQKVCAHTTADLSDRGEALLSGGDVARATPLLEQVAEYRAGSTDEYLALSHAHAKAGDLSKARDYADKALAREGLSEQSKARVHTALADLDWRADDLSAARAGYEALVKSPHSPAEERLVLAKIAALGSPSDAQAVLRPYLLGELPQVRAIVKVGDLSRAYPEDGVVRYLHARLLENAGAHEEGLVEIRAAIDLGLPGAPLLKEAQLMLGRMLLASGDAARARSHFSDIARAADREADVLAAKDWAERAAFVLATTATASTSAGGSARGPE